MKNGGAFPAVFFWPLAGSARDLSQLLYVTSPEQRHSSREFVAEQLDRSPGTGFAKRRKPVKRRSACHHDISAQRHGLGNVAPTANSAVEQDSCAPRNRAYHRGKRIDAGDR